MTALAAKPAAKAAPLEIFAARAEAKVALNPAHILHRDFETRSRAILQKTGAHKYAADSTTEIICAAYAVDDQPVQLWLPSDPVPPEFLEAARDPHWILAAHNDAFETVIEQSLLVPRHGWPIIPVERHVCTMAACSALGLPARLSAAADALELEHRKDPAGERLMRQMSKPRRARRDEDPADVHWFEDDDRRQRLYNYCQQDVEVERELHDRLHQLSAAEQALWVLSSRVNDRGFHVDRQFAEAARRIAQAAAHELNAELAELTAGAVTGINQVARMLQWLQDQGCTVQALGRKTVEKLLEQAGLPSAVLRVLELRLGGAQAAVKKIDSLLARAGDDDRVRGAFRYHGAANGRWAGEGFQPQNLKRPVVEDLDAAIDAIGTGDYARVKELYPRPLAVVGDCSRPMINAAPGHVLIGADFSAVESRILAWVAGEEWKLDSYRRFDATRDPRDEPYCEIACKIFGKPSGTYTKESPERGIGKTCDLAFGYQGGLGAWRNFQPDKFSDAEVETFKNEWRAAHPKIKRFWYDINSAAVLVVRERGHIVRCGRVDLKFTGAFLQLRLPSGRKLSYPQPRIIEDERNKHRVVFADNAAGRFTDCRHGHGAYGGLWAENIVSGIARDLLADAMLGIEAARYPIVLHGHDEIVAEVPIGFGSTDEFTRLMTRKPAWAPELPIKARQLGFSTLIDIVGLDACLFNSSTAMGLIDATLPDAKKKLGKIKFAYSRLPEPIRDAIPVLKDNTEGLEFGNRSSIQVGMSHRGGTLQMLHVSEYGKISAKYPDKAREIKTGAFGTIHTGHFIHVESTAEGTGGEFYELVQRAEAMQKQGSPLSELDFKLHFFAWHQHDGYRLNPRSVVITAELREYFDELEGEHGIAVGPDQRAWYAAMRNQLGPDDVFREYPSIPDEAFLASLEGAYFKREMSRMRADGRLGVVPHDPARSVNTFWDIGVGDQNCIWFHQSDGVRHRLIDYYENSGEGLKHYIGVLDRKKHERGFKYGVHYGPHDLGNREWLSDARPRVEMAKDLGLRFTVVPRIETKADAIEAARSFLNMTWIDEQHCARGLQCLENYRKEWNDRLSTWRDKPLHDWASHGADALMTGVLGFDPAIAGPPRRIRRRTQLARTSPWAA